LDEQPAGLAHEERPRPGQQVAVDPLGENNPAEGGGVNVVTTALNVKEERRDFPFIHLEDPDFVCEDAARVCHSQTW